MRSHLTGTQPIGDFRRVGMVCRGRKINIHLIPSSRIIVVVYRQTLKAHTMGQMIKVWYHAGSDLLREIHLHDTCVALPLPLPWRQWQWQRQLPLPLPWRQWSAMKCHGVVVGA